MKTIEKLKNIEFLKEKAFLDVECAFIYVFRAFCFIFQGNAIENKQIYLKNGMKYKKWC